MAGARVKKLTTTGTFHPQGAERNCQWQRGEGREVEAKNKRTGKLEGEERRSLQMEIQSCAAQLALGTEHDINQACG